MQPWYMLLSIHYKGINVYFYAEKKPCIESANTSIFFDKEKIDNLRRHVYNSMYVFV